MWSQVLKLEGVCEPFMLAPHVSETQRGNRLAQSGSAHPELTETRVLKPGSVFCPMLPCHSFSGVPFPVTLGWEQEQEGREQTGPLGFWLLLLPIPSPDQLVNKSSSQAARNPSESSISSPWETDKVKRFLPFSPAYPLHPLGQKEGEERDGAE